MECLNCGSDNTDELNGEEDEPDVLACYSCGYNEVLREPEGSK